MLFANVALPSFIGHWIVFIILLPLVATIEAIVLAVVLKTAPIDSLTVAIHANWRSTVSGLPLGWCMALAGLVPAGILAFLLPAPYRDPGFQIIAFTAFTGGMIPTDFTMIAMAAGNLLILIPYYFVTVRIEQKVVASHHPEIDPKRVAFAVRWIHRITYTMLALLVLWWLTAAIQVYRNRPQRGEGGSRVGQTRSSEDRQMHTWSKLPISDWPTFSHFAEIAS